MTRAAGITFQYAGLELCLCVVVVVVVVVLGLLVVGWVEGELVPLPPHPATATLLARTASVVSMAFSEVLLIGRAPIVAEGLGRSPYQAFTAPIAAG
jgi:hypothetical protein